MKTIQTVLAALLLGACLQVDAQKLPAVQEKSVYAPADIKIDGKTVEWSDKFQAYNKVTQLYYTLSNDNTSLYLTIYTPDIFTIEKVFAGGISFSVKEKSSKSDPIVISYPTVSRSMGTEMIRNIKEIDDNKYTKDFVNSKFSVASIGIFLKKPGLLIDSILSFNNNLGIRVAGLFNEHKALTYELKVPFTALGQNTNMDAIAYEVRLPGAKVPAGAGNRQLVAGINLGGGAAPPPPSEATLLEMFSPTYFSGTYIMARK